VISLFLVLRSYSLTDEEVRLPKTNKEMIKMKCDIHDTDEEYGCPFCDEDELDYIRNTYW